LKKIIMFLCGFALSGLVEAGDKNLEDFAKSYFKAWQTSQSPNASKKDLEHYLSFLADDVGHQHLPYDPDDSRSPEGKEQFRKGMTYYLGTHTSYEAKLDKVVTGHNVIVITYSTSSRGKHPQTGQVINQNYDTMEVLEIENEKVSVIRKYSK
jgi:ketosteroid isomerase-like protein